MTEKEMIINLLDKVPEKKLGYVLAYVQGITAGERQQKFFLDAAEENTQKAEFTDDDEAYTLYNYMEDCGIEE